MRHSHNNDNDAWSRVDYLYDILVAFGWVIRFAVLWCGGWAVVRLTLPVLKITGIW